MDFVANFNDKNLSKKFIENTVVTIMEAETITEYMELVFKIDDFFISFNKKYHKYLNDTKVEKLIKKYDDLKDTTINQYVYQIGRAHV